MERAGKEQDGFESKLLACEARFRKLERLAAHVVLPDTAVTAVAVDLLRDVVDTLPSSVQQVAREVLQQLYPAIYCEEPLPEAERLQLQEVLSQQEGRQPWFAVVRRQQMILERMEERVQELQGWVDVEEDFWSKS